jgi:hypothetical protein
VLRIDGDTVERVRPWQVDTGATYRTSRDARIDATKVGRGLRVAFGALPRGTAAFG